MFSGWGEFIAGFAVFFVSHAVPVRGSIKSGISTLISPRGFTIVYSTLSTAILAWLIIAAGRAPYIEIWAFAPWQKHVPLAGMAIATIVTALAIGRPNPLSFGGSNNARFDPQNPGLVGWLRHPLLFVLLIWSLAHIVPNGDLAHIILFGVFAGFALLGHLLINRRQKRLLGPAEWSRLTTTKRRLTPTRNGLARLTIGIVLYLLLLILHTPVIGMSPLP
ncbi:MAG: NnrU family protein [Rhodobacterales bacterium]|nr:NnrU family protein [Rhodobacterales bacterium]